MKSCIPAKQPICPVQWKRRRCGPDLITRDCLWQTEAEGWVAKALSEASYITKLHLMAAQECEFGDMPRNLI